MWALELLRDHLRSPNVNERPRRHRHQSGVRQLARELRDRDADAQPLAARKKNSASQRAKKGGRVTQGCVRRRKPRSTNPAELSMDYACERRTNPWEIWALPTEQPRTPPKTSEPNPKRGVELKADCLDDSPTGPMQLKTDRYFTTCLSVSPDFKKDTSRARDSAGCVCTHTRREAAGSTQSSAFVSNDTDGWRTVQRSRGKGGEQEGSQPVGVSATARSESARDSTASQKRYGTEIVSGPGQTHTS